MSPACFGASTKILCLVDGKEVYVSIQDIRKGMIVKTKRDGYRRVEAIGKSSIQNPGTAERIESRLYVCKKENYPELTEDLILTGCHSILVDSLTEEQKAKTIKSLGHIFITSGKCRLMASIDERAEPLEVEGTHPVYHLALESEDVQVNYGVYANGGLLVETICINRLLNKSGMELIE
jgi:hypothetical protein